MTLPELSECSENQENTMPSTATKGSDSKNGTPNNKLGEALLSVLHHAAMEGRATCSLTACVDLLSSRPDDVMLCVMPSPDDKTDAAATIQRTLIRAVCQEHGIRVVSVDCDVKLAKAVCAEEVRKPKVDVNYNEVFKTPSPCSEDTTTTGAASQLQQQQPPLPMIITDCDNLAPVMGFPCALVEYPQESSAEDELVGEFCKKQLYGQHLTEPYIELPD